MSEREKLEKLSNSPEALDDDGDVEALKLQATADPESNDDDVEAHKLQ